jgi:hypothetical protein
MLSIMTELSKAEESVRVRWGDPEEATQHDRELGMIRLMRCVA